MHNTAIFELPPQNAAGELDLDCALDPLAEWRASSAARHSEFMERLDQSAWQWRRDFRLMLRRVRDRGRRDYVRKRQRWLRGEKIY